MHPSIRRLLILAALLPSLAGAGFADDITIRRVLGPEVPTGDYKHPASFDELDNGDLYLVFFSGKGEYGDSSAAVYGSRLKKGGRKWSKPEPIATNPFFALGNAVVWQAPDGLVWLFYVTRYGEIWPDSRITAKISRDGARTWSESFMLTFEAGTMVRGHPIVLSDGNYLLPIYHEVGEDTERVDARCASSFLHFDTGKRVWTETGRIRSPKGNIQPAPVQVTDKHLIAFCRRGGDYLPTTEGWLVRSESFDGGWTWTEGVDSNFKNPNAAVDFIKLRNGHLLLIFNDSMNDRTPLTASISTDQGRTFGYRRNIIEGEGDFGYPTAIQAKDGKIHVVFTSDERTVIQHAVFDESAILEGTL